MAADPRDDFRAFAEVEHMFYGLADPYRLIRSETEAGMRRQVSDTEIDSIVCAPGVKFLTLGRKIEDGARMIVTFFGFCVRTRIALRYAAGTEHDELDATLTFLFGRIDEPGAQVSTVHFDLHGDAERALDDTVFQQRFVAFRERHPTETS